MRAQFDAIDMKANSESAMDAEFLGSGNQLSEQQRRTCGGPAKAGGNSGHAIASALPDGKLRPYKSGRKQKVGGFAMEQRGRVLIVDDNAMNIDVLRRILRKEYELDTAASGEDVSPSYPAIEPQLVLLDIMMPGMDGYETCQRIKSSPLGDSIQVILVSSKGTAADRQGHEVLADDYVVRPFDHNELLDRVRAHVRLKQSPSSRNNTDVSGRGGT